MTTTPSTFQFEVSVPRFVSVKGRKISREDFFTWVWSELSRYGLAGIHEGTLLSEQAAGEGLETESWTLDAGEAPRDRDWVDNQASLKAEFYFDSPRGAEKAREILESVAHLNCGAVKEQLPEDWDAQWKASFLATPDGVAIPPIWRVVPPWTEMTPKQHGEVVIRINPGAGFGTGTHETTQLCMEALATIRERVGLSNAPALDFGSGSGILSIAAALLGARVDGVEIDPLAIDNAGDNARLNGVEDRVKYMRDLGGAPGPYPVVIANILKPILLQFAEELVSRLNTGKPAALILSGLVEKDVEPVRARYSDLIARKVGREVEPRVLSRGEWRAIFWQVG